MIECLMGDILTKKAFAEMTGVSAACVSQWISRNKIGGMHWSVAVAGRESALRSPANS